ncbi:hypothetical protein GGF46_003917 [Coemansia sp. RSA 552]|nr:hypothetical protein GGF46_003917 [Coemansia sp. RSA 552]
MTCENIGGHMSDKHELVVRGYSARVFSASRDKVDLIEAASEPSVRVDRYDVRHLIRPLSESPGSAGLPDPELNEKRFAALAGARVPEHEVFAMDAESRRSFIACIADPVSEDPVSKESGERRAGIGLVYDSEGVPRPSLDPSQSENDAEAFVPSFAVPDGMVLPKAQRHFGVIEHTARFITEQPGSKAMQMEILIQGKQGTNADFEFLNAGSQLHPFYKHIMWLMRTGLYAYGESSSGESSPEQSENGSPPPAGISGAPDGMHIPGERSLVDKVAGLIARASDPLALEQRLRQEKSAASSAYAFLLPHDKFNEYYTYRRDRLISGANEAEIEAAIRQAAAAAAAGSPTADSGDPGQLQAKRRLRASEFLKQKRQR